MKCRQCGTEIADKALICYRCGAATTDSVYKAPPADARLRRSRGGRASVVATVLALALLVLLALYMGRATTAGVPQIVTWIAVAVAVIIVGLRAFKKRN